MEVLQPRVAGKFISLNADYVDVDYTAIRDRAKIILPEMKKKSFDATIYSTHECHPQPHSTDAAQWVFLIDCLNFSFWTDSEEKFKIRYKGNDYTGYYALCAAIIRAIEEGLPILDAKFCSEITEAQVNEIFHSSTSTEVPLLQKRIEIIQEFGSVLLEKFDGKFENAIKQCSNDALKLVDMIEENFPCFRDSTIYNGSKVKFLKRAQIVVADLHACFHGKGFGLFDNIDQLTTFADYRIPQCLAYFGILKYKHELIEILENEIEAGGLYEAEIRGCTIHAVDALVEALKKLKQEEKPKYDNVTLNAMVVDFFLWEYAREHKAKVSKHPFHRVRSHLY
ncbi:queuosine 5'-phosphate N-glycosylase/hydrolase-like [Convolutriloba macropyga]|uniref:queuosine 5'-phosphate N-glycosylase/hydrolase-like n=1 Tax=Convolutriloba macropyga TaxID=536237 RepID=UPI003F51AF5A